MSLKEQVTNLKLIVKNDRRVLAAIGFLAVAIVLWMFAEEPRPQRRATAPAYSVGSVQKVLGGDEAFRDLVKSLGTKVDSVSKTSEEQRISLDRTIKDYQADRAQFKGIFESVADRLDVLDRNLTALEGKMQDLQNAGTPPPPGENGTIVTTGGETIVPQTEVTPPPPPAPAKPLKILFIAPGDSVPVKLLTGVNAPVDGNPYPTLFQLKGPIMGPDGSTLDLGEARLLAIATGSETDSRALFRLTDLALRHKDGRRSVVKVDGWVIGEDGIRGMSGRLIDKLGRLILATMGVSFASTLGDRMTDKADNLEIDDTDSVTIETSDLDSAQTSAFVNASNRLGEILIKRYEKLIPVVEVLSGREVVAVFAAPAEVEVIDEATDEGIYNTAVD